MSTFRKTIIFVLVGLIIVPQITFAAWWNPFTWKIWRIFKHDDSSAATPVKATNPVLVNNSSSDSASATPSTTTEPIEVKTIKKSQSTKPTKQSAITKIQKTGASDITITTMSTEILPSKKFIRISIAFIKNRALRDGENSVGITFENLSNSDISITGLTFLPSFQAIDISAAIILRIYDPAKEIGSYSTTGMIAEQKIGDQTSDITLGNFSYPIPASGKRNLLLTLLRVRKISIGVDPKIVLTVSNINTNPPNMGANGGLTLQWTCLLGIMGAGGWAHAAPVDVDSACQ